MIFGTSRPSFEESFYSSQEHGFGARCAPEKVVPFGVLAELKINICGGTFFLLDMPF